MLRDLLSRSGRPASPRWAALGLGFVVLLTLAGCQFVGGPAVLLAPPADHKAASAPATTAVVQGAGPVAAATAQPFTAKLQLAPARAEVGQVVEARGGGYLAGATVELVWYSVDGKYELEGGTEFVGQRYSETSRVIATAVADASGNITSSLKVPLDFGGSHDLRGRVGGQEVSQAALTIVPTFAMTPREGPVGTPVEIKIVGVDWRTNINTWQVLYDNRYLGFMSAVTTRGVATARFRAAGPVGERQVSVWHNSFYPIPYLNWQQGPYKDVPGADFTFRVTAGQAPAAVIVEDFSAADAPWRVESPGPGKLALSVDRGTVGKVTTLRGSSLPANSELILNWWTMVGNRVSTIGFSPEVRSLGRVQTGSDGTFALDLPIPDDLGGQHRIDVLQGEKVLATAGIVIQPSVVSLSPTRVRAGEAVKIHLKGVGWTTYENTYAVTYDNYYVGYVCGFSTNGDVQFSVTATGAPGVHLIDLYPTIYKGKDPQPRVYSVPQLTYVDDHPQRITPAIRLAIEIVE